MPNERATTIILGDSLDKRIDQVLTILNQKNPETQWSREQVIRLIVGYGLDQLCKKMDEEL